jgi:hypothetical protein
MHAQTIAFWGFVAVAVILLGFAALVLWKLYERRDSLVGLIDEMPNPEKPNEIPKASLSRFQFLIFTFVIAGLFLLLSIEAGTFIDVPANVLILLGISGGSYVISKQVSKTDGTHAAAAGGQQPPAQGGQQ